jgi:hypothetical protein
MKLPSEQQFIYDTGDSSLLQMLAFSLEVRAYLSAGHALKVEIPHKLFSDVPPEVFEELIFDNLSQITPHLDTMLSLQVKPVEYFCIQIQPTGG